MQVQKQIQLPDNINDNIYRLFFKAFSNQTRLKIIFLLKENPMTVSEICQNTKFEQSRISHNLKCLENCGFVTVNKKGNFRIYSLETETIAPIINLFQQHIEKYKEHLNKCEALITNG